MKANGVPMLNVALAGAVVFMLVESISIFLSYKAKVGAGLLIVFLALRSGSLNEIGGDCV